MFTRIVFDRFTAFQKADIKFSTGINVLIGENGTGKTHILKSIYASADVSVTKRNFAEKLTKVYLPSHEHINRLVKRGVGRGSGSLEVFRKFDSEELRLRLSINSWEESSLKATLSGHRKTWFEHPVHSVFIPVKEMLANAPGFKSLYETRNIHFEEVYADIITKALLPPLRGPSDSARRKITAILQKAIDGRVTVQKEEFFLRNKQGNLEFTLLAEGFRKLGLLWTLLQNGTLLNGSVLFWDEPEANLNPKLIKTLIEVLIALQRMGVQVFISTHNYTVLKEFDLQLNPTDKVYYHSLYRNPNTNEVEVNTTDQYDRIDPNKILDTFTDMYDREISRSY